MYNLEIIDKVKREMQEIDRGNPERIQHFTKVHSFATQIAREEKIDEKTYFILELTSILHDIGIRYSEEKYGYSTGKTQEEIGPSYAENVLRKFEVEEEIVKRVSYIIGKHHTYDNVDGMDYRILLEADFLVNLYENQVDMKGILSAYKNIFVTKSGKDICKIMFDFSDEN